MKKIFSVVSAILLISSFLFMPVLAHKNNKSYGDVPKSKDAITLDGDKDAVYDKGLILPVDLDKLYGDDGCSARGTAYLLWQDGFLYVFAEIKDPYVMPQGDYVDQSGQPWMTDSLEVFLDPSNSLEDDAFDQYRIDAYGYRSFELRATGDRASSYNEDESVANGIFEGKAKLVSGGYNVEFKIPITKGAGSDIGMLLQINDMDDSGNRTLAFTRASAPVENEMSWFPVNADYIVLSANEVTAASAVVPAGSGTNIAAQANVTTSSDYNEDYAGILCVHEGEAEHDTGTEWASAGELNPWIKFDFTNSVWINKIILCDRSNTADWSKIVTITFSDGSNIVTGELDDLGAPYTVDFDPKNVTWVQFDVTEAGDDTLNNGFGRISIYDTVAPAVPVAPAPNEVVPAPAPLAVGGGGDNAPSHVPEPVPATGDCGIILAVLALIGSTAAIFVLKIKKNRI